MSEEQKGFFHHLDRSAIFTIIGIVFLFSTAVLVTLIAPRYMDRSWIEPASLYQAQMHEIADSNLYIGKQEKHEHSPQAVYHLQKGKTLSAFRESETMKIVSSKELEPYITRYQEPVIKVSSRLLLLRKIDRPEEKDVKIESFELYEPEGSEAFALASADRIIEDWVDNSFEILDNEIKQPKNQTEGVIYINNPKEYRIKLFEIQGASEWRYDPSGDLILSKKQLDAHPLQFRSRKSLISYGEHLYAIEGCWYCHTDQNRTLVQDCVLNGCDVYPAPPSSANEYVYQEITFPGTRRIGPDVSRVGIKRPSRAWQQSHFWSPQTTVKDSIMPAFRHFFDSDPKKLSEDGEGLPNDQFEAMFQYLMIKGTRITPPSQAWWLGKDPMMTKEIIEEK